MENIHITFETHNNVKPNEMRKCKIRPGYEHVNMHMILNIKIYDMFTMKSILVADGHIIAPP